MSIVVHVSLYTPLLVIPQESVHVPVASSQLPRPSCLVPLVIPQESVHVLPYTSLLVIL